MATIVLEGPDGTGKTTLAQAFKKRGFKYVHNGPPPLEMNMFDYYLGALLNARGKNVVFDRLHLGEYAYGPIMRDGSKITVEDIKMLNRALHSSPGVVVLCDTGDERIKRAWERNAENEYVNTPEKLLAIAERFRWLWENLYFESKLEYNYHGTNQEAFITDVIENLKYPHDGAGRPTDGHEKWTVTSMSGVLLPRFLFVGERPGGSVDLGFCTMKGSSGYLNECLWKAGFRESELAFINAYDHYGTARSIKCLWEFLYRPQVVALGLEAKNACLKEKLRCESLEHPSYRKRFHLKETHEYVAQLRRLRDRVIEERVTDEQ